MLLFPAIFWKQHVVGSYDGAIPVAFLNQDSVPNSYGYAGISGHLIARITSSDLLCSTLPEYLYFAFDTIHIISSQGKEIFCLHADMNMYMIIYKMEELQLLDIFLNP